MTPARPKERREPLALSDELPELLEMASSIFRQKEVADAFGHVARIRLVVDANVVLSDLIFHLVTKREAGARRALEELVACGVVEALAPDVIVIEVEKYLPELAAKHRRPLDAFQAEWSRYRAILKIVPTADLPPVVSSPDWEFVSKRDPKDLPYLLVHEGHDAQAIISWDPHFPPTVRASGDVLVDLRDYARSKAITVKIQLMGTTVLGLSAACVVPLVKAAAGLVQSAARIPLVQACVVAALVVAAFSPDVRKRAGEMVDQLITSTTGAWEVVGPALMKVAEEFMAADARARSAMKAATNKLPPAAQS